MEKLIGQLLDNRYEIIEVIGVGGMAVVYKALDHRLNRFVAVKVLKDEYSTDQEFRRRFHDESQSVAMLSHPNIVSVYDVSRSSDIEYIVMELIEGMTLKDYLERRGPLTWKETTFFSMQIARALEHAHSRGIIHRDIKPQNIMLLRDGTVKVADFGIARHMARQHTYNISEAIGSVHYVSPEQAKGSHIDTRADIYSFGVVMYEMLTGRLPFEGDSAVSVALQHINSIPLLPSEHVKGVPGALENITMKAMNPALSRRYASATAMLRDLEGFKSNPEFFTVMPDEADAQDAAPKDAEATRKLDAPPRRREPAAPKGEKTMSKNTGTSAPAGGKKKRGGLSTSLVFSMLALLIFFGGAVYFIVTIINPFSREPGTTDPDKLTIPYLVGRQYNDALKLEYSQFEIVEGESLYIEDVAAGEIISQTPSADRPASEGDKITVNVSRGPRTTQLTSLANMEYRAAEALLDRMNIFYVETFENSETVEKDNIIRTDPEEGTQLQSGDTVILVISLGRTLKEVKMPDLTGKTETEARALLEPFHLTLGTVTPVDSQEPDKTIVFQTVPAGSTVLEETIVDVQISRNETPTGPGTNPGTQPPYEPVKRSVLYTFDLIEAVGLITVDVRVNGEVQYTGSHYSYEVKLALTLTAYEGDNLVQVYQNGDLITEQTVKF